MEKIPNLISFLRLILSPFVFFLHKQEKTLEATILFLLLAITDALDGFIAKRFNAETKLGKFLDPFADKVLIFFGMLSVIVEENPLLFFLVIARDITLIFGSLILKKHGFIPQPSIAGKLATLFLSLTVILGFLKSEIDIFEHIFDLFQILSMFFVIVSGLQYMFRGLKFVYG